MELEKGAYKHFETRNGTASNVRSDDHSVFLVKGVYKPYYEYLQIIAQMSRKSFSEIDGRKERTQSGFVCSLPQSSPQKLQD